MADTNDKPAVDMEQVELAYRAGVMPLRQVGAMGGVSAATILKWAKKHGWERDLSAKIKAKADAKVNAAAVNKPVNVNTAVHERETVEANAEAIARIRLGHRTDISKGRGIVVKLLGELDGITDRPELIEDLQQALHDAELGDEPDDVDRQAARGRAQRLREALDRVISLQGRVASVKGLAEAMKNLIGLERQAWGLDDDGGEGDTGRALSDVERATRLAGILDRARRARAAAEAQ